MPMEITGARDLSRGLLSHVQPPQEIDIISSRMVSRNWRNSEEEEYLWEDMSPRLENHGRGSDNSRKDDYFPGDLKKWLGLEREKRMGLEPALPDSDWQMHGPLSHMDRPMMSEKERRPPRRVGFFLPALFFDLISFDDKLFPISFFHSCFLVISLACKDKGCLTE
jgi:hypothetical protein